MTSDDRQIARERAYLEANMLTPTDQVMANYPEPTKDFGSVSSTRTPELRGRVRPNRGGGWWVEVRRDDEVVEFIPHLYPDLPAAHAAAERRVGWLRRDPAQRFRVQIEATLRRAGRTRFEGGFRPAGVVHRGAGQVPPAAFRRFGPDALDRLNEAADHG